jgi:glucosamine--fructose-6-phosphate aminotransferase (isomerizing)
MCGIFSVYLSENFKNKSLLNKYVSDLLVLSQTRGKDASGVAVNDIENNIITVYREPISASNFIKQDQYKNLFKTTFGKVCVVGHNRLATNGSNGNIKNNQPIHVENIVCAQNGIVTNFSDHNGLDTYLITEMFLGTLKQNNDVIAAGKEVFSKVHGENNLIIDVPEYKSLYLATNTGSIYYIDDRGNGLFIAASEKYILEVFADKNGLQANIKQLKPHEHFILNYGEVGVQKNKIIDLEDEFFAKLNNLKRCSKCILPETFPNISFNEDGVCNFCMAHVPFSTKGDKELEELFSKYRSKDGSPDCLIAFSGGRDSSYTLHLLKTKYKMNPIAYSYDWGMVTDLARRNQARMCEKLGVEHIWVSADIRKKRKNIRKNVESWMQKPDIGMVPLFMAGDKAFFYHANKVMEKNNLKLIIFSPNHLEKTTFKAGFCGVKSSDFGDQVHKLKLSGKIKLLTYYMLQYIKNPRYINSSIFDVAFAFLSYFVMKQDFLYFFDYEPWLEAEVDNQLKQYNWEWDPNYKSSWRIGDGTAALYNMIYYMHSGFTENDCFRSNQIRENMMSRDEALQLTLSENQPRLDSVEEYCRLIDVNFVDLINAIRRIKYAA